MKQDLGQNGFAAGIISPSSYGRVDLAAYQAACRDIQNALPTARGGLTKRPAFVHYEFVSDSSKLTRIAPFVANTREAFLIEIGEGDFRIRQSGLLLDDDVGDSVLASPRIGPSSVPADPNFDFDALIDTWPDVFQTFWVTQDETPFGSDALGLARS